jgi:hypothetical protein
MKPKLCFQSLIFLILTFGEFSFVAAQNSDPQIQSFGWLQLSMVPGWQADEAASKGDFFTFSHITNGKPDYVIQVKKQPVDCLTKKDFNKMMVKIFYEMYARQDYVDKFKDDSNYGALGQSNSHLITFNLKDTKERGFILSPWINGKMYNIYIYDKISQKKELREEALAFLGALKVNPSANMAQIQNDLASAGISPKVTSDPKKPNESPPPPSASGNTSLQAPTPGKTESVQEKTGSTTTGINGPNPVSADKGITPQQPSPSNKKENSQPANQNNDQRLLVPENTSPRVTRPPGLIDPGKFAFESDIDFSTMTSAQYTGAVSMAMEGMRLIYGEMSPDDEKSFQKEWLPLFEYPCKEVVDYLNLLNPLISKFLAIRETLGSEIENYNASVLVITIAAGENDTIQIAETMSEMEITVSSINTLQQQMQGVTDEIVRLGNPPDAVALAEGRRKHHRNALSLISPNNFPFEGEWETADGSNILMKVLKVFDDGKVLVYQFPVSTLQKWEANGIDISKPGMEYNEKTKGMTLIPGIYDLLRIFEPMEDGSWSTLDWSFIRIISIYKGNRDKADILQYRPPNELANTSGVSNYTLTRTSESYPVPPVLPIDGNPAKWDKLVKVVPERKWDQKKYDSYMKWRNEYPDELVMAVRGGPTPLEERKRIYLQERQKIEDEYKAKKDAGIDEGALKTSVDLTMYMKQIPASERPRVEKERREIMLKDIETSNEDRLKFLNQQYADIFAPIPADQQPKPEVSQELTDYLKSLKEWETQEAIKKQKEEQIKFHETNVKYFEGNIESLKGRLAGSAVDANTRNRLTRDLLYQQDAMQKEQDAISTIKTGEYTHTRTDLDALNMQMMAERGREMAEEAHRIQRTMERMPKLLELADPSDRARLREFFERNMVSPETGNFDPERMRNAAKTMGNQVTGQLEKKAAESEEWAAAVNGMVEGLEYVKTGADISMTVLSLAAPVYFAHSAPNAIAASMRAAQAAKVFFGYQGIAGYVEGGVTGAFTRVASSYNTVTMMANAAINGYQQGVLDHLEEHSRNAATHTLNENKAGLWGMGWEVGKEALKTVVFRSALGALMPANPKGAPVKWSDVADSKGNPVNQSSTRWPTIQQQIQQAQFISRQADGRAKVKLFQERVQKVAAAGKAGASKEEMQQLRTSMEEAYKVVKTDLFAKQHINALARQGDLKTTAHYNSCERTYLSKLQSEVEQELVNAGFNSQKCRTYSNSSSNGKVGADLDMGVVEPPRYKFDATGKRIPNPEHIAWRQNLTIKDANGIRRSSPQELQKIGQEILERSFAKIYGKPSGEAMVEFTTSYHPEAYRDLAWLGSKGTKTAMVFETNKAWVQQAADVSAFKVNTLPANHPQLGYYGIMQEQMRGLTKDFNTKIEPMLKLKAKSNPKAVEHLYELRNTMDKFAKNEIGPIEAEHKIRELTGGKGLAEAAEQLGVAMRGLRNTLK